MRRYEYKVIDTGRDVEERLIYDEADPRQGALMWMGAVSLLRGGGRS
jgi:hypothetical protein